METPLRLAIILAAGFTLLSPLIFIAIRQAIKYERQESITDLALVFETTGGVSLSPIPSFEFLKYKYFVGAKRGPTPSAVLASANPGAQHPDRYKEDYTTLHWLIGSVPFGVLSAVAAFYGLSILVALLDPAAAIGSPFRWPGVTYPAPGSVAMVWLLGLCAALAGSYVTALRSLYRATKTFDLSPGSFVSETIRMLLSAVLVPILIVGLFWIGTETIKAFVVDHAHLTAPSIVAVMVTACFIAGIMPDVVLRNIIQGDRLKNFKREETVFEAFKITPVEIIDGIDSEIRVRLDDHHIRSTQNLATANPLMLFVETPYGVYQIMDWVAQAQLCCSVGRDKLIRLWSLGIRTLFDLERLAASRDPANEALLLEVGRILLGEGLVPKDATPRTSAALVRANIELRLDDPHVRRLRQIYIAVGNRLGTDSRRFEAHPFQPRGRLRHRFTRCLYWQPPGTSSAPGSKAHAPSDVGKVASVPAAPEPIRTASAPRGAGSPSSGPADHPAEARPAAAK